MSNADRIRTAHLAAKRYSIGKKPEIIKADLEEAFLAGYFLAMIEENDQEPVPAHWRNECGEDGL